MTRRLRMIVLLVAVTTLTARAQAPVPFDEFFLDKALRFDLYQVGDAKDEAVTLDQVYEEALWPESRTHLIDPFIYGHYAVELYDVASNRLIYSRGFDSTFAEYRTTTPALNGVKRVFERSIRVPHPRRPFLFVIEGRDKFHVLHPLFTQSVDPSDYHIIRETTAAGDFVYEARVSGDPHGKVDLAFLAEGYAAEDRDKFKADVDRMSTYLFTVEPYKSAKERFNIRGVFRPSPERAMDEPRQRVYRKTVLNAAFNAFDLDRYMLIEEDHRMHEIAAEVPYDAIIVLVNSKRYGGGSIGFDYCVATVDNPVSPQTLIHELGHSFAGLADEYYTSEVSYNDFYPKGVEPLEPNITALLDPAKVKWKDLLSPGISVPTEYGKEKREALWAERRKNREDQMRAVEEAKKNGASAAKVKAVESKFLEADKAIARKIEDLRKQYAALEDKVGAFEGAGYSSKGLYRPQMYCIMISSPKGEFCRVCQRAISWMIDYFGEGK
ncbi:MAG TPA: M64 family metallopeptidase [Burkholderiales bacterium]|nr:M64 family metallopeptidase [Burkholderiales bacterium]